MKGGEYIWTKQHKRPMENHAHAAAIVAKTVHVHVKKEHVRVTVSVEKTARVHVTVARKKNNRRSIPLVISP